jgi:hypothetical protein
MPAGILAKSNLMTVRMYRIVSFQISVFLISCQLVLVGGSLRQYSYLITPLYNAVSRCWAYNLLADSGWTSFEQAACPTITFSGTQTNPNVFVAGLPNCCRWKLVSLTTRVLIVVRTDWLHPPNAPSSIMVRIPICYYLSDIALTNGSLVDTTQRSQRTPATDN